MRPRLRERTAVQLVRKTALVRGQATLVNDPRTGCRENTARLPATDRDGGRWVAELATLATSHELPTRVEHDYDRRQLRRDPPAHRSDRPEPLAREGAR